jgi:hypothetical protein
MTTCDIQMKKIFVDLKEAKIVGYILERPEERMIMVTHKIFLNGCGLHAQRRQTDCQNTILKLF